MRFHLGLRTTSSSLALQETRTAASEPTAVCTCGGGNEYELQWHHGQLPLMFSDELGEDLPPFVSHVTPCELQEKDVRDNQGFARVAVGHLLIEINHQETSQLGFAKAMHLLNTPPPRFHPMVLRFRVPMSLSSSWVAMSLYRNSNILGTGPGTGPGTSPGTGHGTGGAYPPLVHGTTLGALQQPAPMDSPSESSSCHSQLQQHQQQNRSLNRGTSFSTAASLSQRSAVSIQSQSQSQSQSQATTTKTRERNTTTTTTTGSSVASTVYMPNDLRCCEPQLPMKKLISRESSMAEQRQVVSSPPVPPPPPSAPPPPTAPAPGPGPPPVSRTRDSNLMRTMRLAQTNSHRGPNDRESARERRKRNQFSVVWDTSHDDRVSCGSSSSSSWTFSSDASLVLVLGGAVVFKPFSAIQDIPIVETIVNQPLLLRQGQAMDLIQHGDALIGINNRNTKKLGFDQTLTLLQTTSRPCVLRFQRLSSSEDRRRRRAKRQWQQSMLQSRSWSPPRTRHDDDKEPNRRTNKLFQSEIHSKLDFVPLHYVKQIFARAHDLPLDQCDFRGIPLLEIQECSVEAGWLRVYAEQCYRQSRQHVRRNIMANHRWPRRQTDMESSTDLSHCGQNRMEADRLVNLFVQRNSNGLLHQQDGDPLPSQLPLSHFQSMRMREESMDDHWDQRSSYSVFLDVDSACHVQEPGHHHHQAKDETKLSSHSSHNSTVVGSMGTTLLLHGNDSDSSWPMLGSILRNSYSDHLSSERVSVSSDVIVMGSSSSLHHHHPNQHHQQLQQHQQNSVESVKSFTFDDHYVNVEDQTDDHCLELRPSVLDELNLLTVHATQAYRYDQHQEEIDDDDDDLLEVISNCSTEILLGDISPNDPF